MPCCKGTSEVPSLLSWCYICGRAYAIRDYYPFWKSRNERSRAGKVLLLDPADQDTIQIFFDDNIGYGAAHIVDVRDVLTGGGLAFQASALLFVKEKKSMLTSYVLLHVSKTPYKLN